MPSAAVDEVTLQRFQEDLDRLTGGATAPRLGIALSGGPDSCALLLLAAAAAPGRTWAMTVDHGLRAEAVIEAEAAGRLCATLDVPHRIERVGVAARGQGLQAAARDARYAALTGWAVREGLDAVLTAHHADDQAETMLMRLARGAGIGGLAGIRPARAMGGTRLLRPLLGWRKAELEAIVAAAGHSPARDPSNDDGRFDRTAARRLLAEVNWLDPVRLARSADHARDADDALGWMVDELCQQAIEDGGDEASIPAHLPREIVRRLIVRLLANRFAKSPDGPAIERAMAALQRGEIVTIADVLARAEGARWHFRPAPPRRSA